MSKATHPIDGEPTLREIIAELASGAFIESHDDGRNELRRPGRFVGQHTLVYHLLREGWLEQWANGGGYRLSEAGRLAYMGSTDELGDGELRAPASGVAPAGAAAVLRDVVRCLRETGRYVDEEGEETDRLQELLDALPADGVLAQPTGKTTDADGVDTSSAPTVFDELLAFEEAAQVKPTFADAVHIALAAKQRTDGVDTSRGGER